MRNKASLAEWLQHLETLHPNEMELGLERVSSVARTLDLIPARRPVITIAGTNGKGSTAAVIEAVLGQMGLVCGLCSSPHFRRFNERIRVGGQEVDDAAIVAAFVAIEAARGDTSLTYFEFATLAALVVFDQRQVDILALEVGLGGRLDAVNLIDADVAVITSIDLDHQEWLGETRAQIAVEKAGIIRPGRPVVIGDPAPPAALVECIGQRQARARYFGDAFKVYERDGQWWGELTAQGQSPRQLPAHSAGGVMPVNALCAAQALLLAGLDFSDEHWLAALGTLQLPGRREALTVAGRDYLLDVSHNPAAIDKLQEYIALNPCPGRNIALFSAMSDKDLHAMIERIKAPFDAWFLADQPNNPRAASSSDIAALLAQQGIGMVSSSKNLTQAFRRAQTIMSPGDRLVVFGSFFTVAAIMPLLDKDRTKERS